MKNRKEDTYTWMYKKAEQFLNAMRNPTKRVGLTGTSNPIRVVDGGKTKPTGMVIHVDDEGDAQETQPLPACGYLKSSVRKDQSEPEPK